VSDGLQDLLGEMYAEDSDGPRLGSLCWAPIFYVQRSINVIRPLSADPADPDFKKYAVRSVSLGQVGRDGEAAVGPRFPDKNLNLSLDEDLFVVRGKRRLVAVLFHPRVEHEAVTADGGKTAEALDLCHGCLPAYTLVDQHGNPRHKAVFVENLRALKYSVTCYLPGHPRFRDRESFLRMDRLSWLPREAMQPLGVRLNRIGMQYVSSWYAWFCGTQPLPEEVDVLRELLLEALDAERNSKQQR